MMWLYIALGVLAVLIILTAGALIGFQLRKTINVGTLLVITDPNDGEKYLTLEIKKNMADYIYDHNEITLTVIERTGKFPQKKQGI